MSNFGNSCKETQIKSNFGPENADKFGKFRLENAKSWHF